MKSLSCLIVIFSLAMISCQSYDFLLFVVEVPGTVCQQYNCPSQYILNLQQSTLNMHGLWPNYNNGSYPSNCGSLAQDSYSDSKVSSSVLSQLNSNWVGLFSDTYKKQLFKIIQRTEFRNHEWEKHGSCFIQDMPQSKSKNLRTANLDSNMNSFFNTVMQTKQALNLESVVYSQSQWQQSDLQNGLSQLLGVQTFNFNCDSNNNLYTLNICLDPTQYTPINCPSTQGFKQNCQDGLNVPQFSSSY